MCYLCCLNFLHSTLPPLLLCHLINQQEFHSETHTVDFIQLVESSEPKLHFLTDYDGHTSTIELFTSLFSLICYHTSCVVFGK